MESSIAVFLWRQPACERLPTSFAAASLPTIWVGLLRPSACCAFLPPRLAVGSMKHTVVIFYKQLKEPAHWSLSLFQPKIATVEDIAIALVEIKLLAGWRNLRDI